MKVDVHNHLWPKEYIGALSRLVGTPYAVRADEKTGTLVIGPSKNTLHGLPLGKCRDMATRISDMNNAGVDVQAVSLPGPSLVPFDRNEAVRVARLVNDSFAALSGSYPGRSVGFAALPLQDVNASLEELDRAVNELGLRGIGLLSNIGGKPLDSGEFWPIYERAAKYDVPVLIHPTRPAWSNFIEAYGMIDLIGFPLDTTISAFRLILSGVLDKYSDLKLILAHMGGALPYLSGRAGELAMEHEHIRANIRRPLDEYFRLLYYDTGDYKKATKLYLKLVAETAGWDHVLFGTDYPFLTFESRITNLDALDVSDADKAKVYGENAMRLLRIRRL